MPNPSKNAAALLMEDIAANPADRDVLHDALREKIHALQSRGQPVPRELRRLESALTEPEGDELWDNLPV